MMSAQTLTIHDLWGILNRRKWLIVGFVLVSLAVAWTLCRVLPKSYKSTTLIMVESQQVPEHYVKGVVTGTAQDRLATLEHILKSRTLLSRVIELSNLYPLENEAGGKEAAVGKLRKRIEIKTLKDQAFSISFSHEDPRTAQKVTSNLASLFIEKNLRVREELVEGASEFLMSELDKAKSELEARERAISEFKRAYMGELPQQLEANLRTLDRLQIETLTLSETLASRNDRLGMIEKAIKEFEATGTISPALPASNRKVGLPRSRLKELRQTLAGLRAVYKENYPDIIQLKEEIARLEAQPPTNDDEQALDAGAMVQAGDSHKTKTVDPYLRELMKQRSELRLEIDSLKQHQSRLTKEIKEYEARVERTPSREQKLMVLIRDYDNMQKNYQALLEKRLNARISENLERRQKGEQFRVIDPANLPGKPESPDPLKIMLAGLALGCGLGVGLAVVLEQLSVSFHRPEEIESLLGLPLLAAIPSFESEFGVSRKALPFSPSAPALTTSGKQKGLLPPLGKPGNGNGKITNGQTVVRGFSPALNLVCKWRPSSVIAEQFRVAATRLVLMGSERSSTVVVVTSALKGEGKSTTALNLGYVLAQDLGKKTLFIDCDLKRPMLHTYVGVSLEPGLARILQGDHSLEACLQPLGESPLWILPAGSIARQPVELFKINRLRGMLTELRSRFDYIILDAPPILPLADMHVLASMADVLVLTVRAQATTREVVQKAIKTLRPTNQVGIVLTGLKADWTPYYMQKDYYARPDA